MEWLNSMRLGEGGFISTVDTVVALQALVAYSYHSRIKVSFDFIFTLLIFFKPSQSQPAHRLKTFQHAITTVKT